MLPLILQGLRIPVVASPMFIVSGPDLVIAQCKAGIVGSFPALNAREKDGEPSMLDAWLTRIEEELDRHNQANPDHPAAPFAVNQIVHRSNARLERDIEICHRHKVPIWITSLGARVEVNQAAHDCGGIALHDVINNMFAKKAVEKGADGLIAVLAAQVMGADLAYIGSPFIATEEANAQPDYKQMIVDSTAADIVTSSLFTGVSGNYLAPSIRKAGLDPDNLAGADASAMNFSDGSSKPKAWSTIWGAGQGIGAVRAVEPAGARIDRLAAEYQAAKEAVSRL